MYYIELHYSFLCEIHILLVLNWKSASFQILSHFVLYNPAIKIALLNNLRINLKQEELLSLLSFQCFYLFAKAIRSY